MQIKKVPQGESSTESVYQVEDESSLQGVFYLTVDREAGALRVYSLDQSGQPDPTDALLLAARIGIEEAEEVEGGYEWAFADDAALASMLTQVVGEHSEILARDLGIEGAAPADFDASLLTDPAPDDSELPGTVDVGDMEFEFDPTATAGDTGAGGDNDPALDPGDPTGDMSAPGDEPPPGMEPGEIDLDNPVPPEDEEEEGK
jgi:hypothetical protein